MPPEQNQNQPYPVDYLNQISSQPKKSGINNKMFLMIVGGGILLAVIAVVLMIASSGGGPKAKMQTLAARLTTLQTIASDAQKTIKSGDLRSTNSNLSIFLANTNRDIVEPLGNNGVDAGNIDKNIVARESGEELIQTLEDARLNAVFDRTYAREMSYQLDTVSALIRDIYNSTNSSSLKTFLENTNTNLEPLREQFSSFDAATS